jgi:hypothetical protein
MYFTSRTPTELYLFGVYLLVRLLSVMDGRSMFLVENIHLAALHLTTALLHLAALLSCVVFVGDRLSEAYFFVC